ncbi:PRA1 family protein F3-like [Mercurialis annua]|uniref:PRA1 family protein F3-like n=1 Tax=Mercurialis annua TaxID=3986 RepID=UPI002160023D|nr:PRA1 family protein F3-like [Mercurialis annua]
MTQYGTIPTSTSTNLDYISSRAKQRLKEGLATRRSWKQMFNYHSFNLPKTFQESLTRMKTNTVYFRMNYAIIVLVILFLSLLYHPISMIVFVVMAAAWVILYFMRDEPLVVLGRLVDDRVVMIVLAVLTVGFLILSGVTLNVLSSLLIGVVVVVVHGVVRKTDDLAVDEEEEATGLLSSAASAAHVLLGHGSVPSSSSS